MKAIQSKPSLISTYILWILATSLALGIGQYMGLKIRDINLDSTNKILSFIPALALNGLIIGVMISLAQGAILKLNGRISRGWIPMSITAYTLGSPLGFVLATLISLQLAGIPLRELTPNHFLLVPLVLMMILNGAIVALIQWIAFAHSDLSTNLSNALLWILGTVLAWGIFPFIDILPAGKGLTFLESAMFGVVVGIVTGAILLFIFPRHTKITGVSASE